MTAEQRPQANENAFAEFKVSKLLRKKPRGSFAGIYEAPGQSTWPSSWHAVPKYVVCVQRVRERTCGYRRVRGLGEPLAVTRPAPRIRRLLLAVPESASLACHVS